MKIYKIKVNGKTYKVELDSVDEVKEKKGLKSILPTKKKEEKKETKKVSTGEGREVLAPIQGTVTKINVKEGSQVKKGDVLLFIEAMKLENEVCSPCDGVISDVLVSKGAAVTSKQLLVKIK